MRDFDLDGSRMSTPRNMELCSGFRADFSEPELAIRRRNRIIRPSCGQRQPRANQNWMLGQQVIEKQQGRWQPAVQAHTRQNAECGDDGVRLDDL